MLLDNSNDYLALFRGAYNLWDIRAKIIPIKFEPIAGVPVGNYTFPTGDSTTIEYAMTGDFGDEGTPIYMEPFEWRCLKDKLVGLPVELVIILLAPNLDVKSKKELFKDWALHERHCLKYGSKLKGYRNTSAINISYAIKRGYIPKRPSLLELDTLHWMFIGTPTSKECNDMLNNFKPLLTHYSDKLTAATKFSSNALTQHGIFLKSISEPTQYFEFHFKRQAGELQTLTNEWKEIVSEFLWVANKVVMFKLLNSSCPSTLDTIKKVGINPSYYNTNTFKSYYDSQIINLDKLMGV